MFTSSPDGVQSDCVTRWVCNVTWTEQIAGFFTWSVYSRGRQTFWGRGPDEPPTNLLRAGQVN